MTGQNSFEHFGVMIDNSRNAVMNPKSVKMFIDALEKMGYNFLMLYTEDTYEVNNQPYFGHLRGRYSKEELKELVAYGDSHHVELIPCIQTLAHLNALIRWPHYAELKDCHDILRVGDDKVYELIEDIFATLDECFTSRIVHIGMDEAGFIGLGTYMQKHGIRNRMDILLEHLNRVSKIAEKYDYQLIMWGDMFYKLTGDGNSEVAEFNISLKDKIPSNVTLVYWDYYSKDKAHYDERIENYQKLQQVWFAGGTWTWTGFAPHLTYSRNISEVALQSCKEHSVKNYFTTLWGDDGGECSRFSVLPELYRLAQAARGIKDEDVIKSGFYEMFHIAYDDFMLTELPDTPNMDGDYFNPDKYMLYNDCLTGSLDSTVNGTEAARYAVCAEKIRTMCDVPTYGIIFETLYRLCRLLEVKYELGTKTRKLYMECEREKLLDIIPLYDENIKRLEAFYEAYERQWMWENKPHGFDVMDIRLGGLLMRLCHAKQRIYQYATGEIERIEELEEPVLEVNNWVFSEMHKTTFYNSWVQSATSNTIAHPNYS